MNLAHRHLQLPFVVAALMAFAAMPNSLAAVAEIAQQSPALLWQYTPILASAPCAQPVTTGDLVVYAGASTVFAVERSSGKLRWSRKCEAKRGGEGSPIQSLAISGSHLLAICPSELYLMDLRSGSDSHCTALPGKATAFLIDDAETLLLGTEAGVVQSITIHSDGAIRPSCSALFDTSPMCGLSMTPTGNVVVVSRTGKVGLIDPHTGKILAQAQLPGVPLPGPPAVSNHRIIFAFENHLQALSETDLSWQWMQTFPEELTSPPVATEGSVLACTQSGSLYSLDAAGGSEKWGVVLNASERHGYRLARWGSSIATTDNYGRLWILGEAEKVRPTIVWQAGLRLKADDPSSMPESAAANPLCDGVNLFVVGRGGSLTCYSRSGADTQAPEFQNCYPLGASVTRLDAASIGARIVDMASGVDPRSVRIFIDGILEDRTAFDQLTGDCHYTPVEPLAEGPHTVLITASDYREHVQSTRWQFTLGKPTPTLPVLMPVKGVETRFIPNYADVLRPFTRWAHFPISVAISHDRNWSPARQQATLAGLDAWQTATHGRISYRLLDDPAKAQVVVRFDPTRSDGLTRTDSVNGQIMQATIVLGTRMPENTQGEMPDDDLSCESAHEYAHSLGINGHSNERGDLMYSSHTIGQPWSIGERDLNTLWTDYPGLAR